jgi:hypothetical protein
MTAARSKPVGAPLSRPTAHTSGTIPEAGPIPRRPTPPTPRATPGPSTASPDAPPTRLAAGEAVGGPVLAKHPAHERSRRPREMSRPSRPPVRPAKAAHSRAANDPKPPTRRDLPATPTPSATPGAGPSTASPDAPPTRLAAGAAVGGPVFTPHPPQEHSA